MHPQLTRLIRDIPDFPKKGIMFKDVTPLLADPAGLALAIGLVSGVVPGIRAAKLTAVAALKEIG